MVISKLKCEISVIVSFHSTNSNPAHENKKETQQQYAAMYNNTCTPPPPLCVLLLHAQEKRVETKRRRESSMIQSSENANPSPSCVTLFSPLFSHADLGVEFSHLFHPCSKIRRISFSFYWELYYCQSIATLS